MIYYVLCLLILYNEFYLQNVYSVAGRCVSIRFKSFGGVLEKTRQFIIKYRISSKAKAWLRCKFSKRLAGYVVTRFVNISYY